MRAMLGLAVVVLVGGAIGAAVGAQSAADDVKRAALKSATDARDRSLAALSARIKALDERARMLSENTYLRSGVVTDAKTVQDMIKEEGLSILAAGDLYEVWSRGEAAPQLFAAGGARMPTAGTIVGA